MTDLANSPLGRATHYADAYDPSLLFPVERAPQREALGIAGALPFRGADVWSVWEVSWLDPQHRPRAAIAVADVPCTSPRIVESKSVKLYFASLHSTVHADAEALRLVLARDLGGAVGTDVAVRIALPDAWKALGRQELRGSPIDDVPLPVVARHPDPALLRAQPASLREVLGFRGFRSVCPVTGQPDHADVEITVEGCRIDRSALLAYLVAFRHHPGFHEHCAERIFVDVWRACAPRVLSVVARFTRRGGIDITPWRSSDPAFVPDPAPTARQ